MSDSIPKRHGVPADRRAQLHGGPHDGHTVTRRIGSDWVRFRDDQGRPISGPQGEGILRHPHGQRRGVYVHVMTPAPPTAPVAHAYVYADDLPARHLAWRLVATALAGSQTGRILTGGSDDPEDVLSALADHVDDLIRARHHRDAERRRTGRAS